MLGCHDNTISSPSAPAHFLSETTFRPGSNPGRNVVSDKKCAGAEEEEMVIRQSFSDAVRICYPRVFSSVFVKRKRENYEQNAITKEAGGITGGIIIFCLFRLTLEIMKLG